MLRITNFRIPITEDTPLEKLAAKRLKLPTKAVTKVTIIREALDARRKNNINFVYSLEVETALPEGQILARLRGDKDISAVMANMPEPIEPGQKPLVHQPVIIGLGPAGLFAALVLAEHGYKPLVLERGRDVDARIKDISAFWQKGIFDSLSNVQFGEGGAGTFSDGKLTTRVQDPMMKDVLDAFIAAGAPPEIGYVHKPHIGTDKLRGVVKKLRQKIIALGGQVEFLSQVTDVKLYNGELKGLVVNGSRHIPCDVAIFAIGHSARDTYEMLYQRGVAMEAKPFAIGVRIEHPQAMLDIAQYGQAAGHPRLRAADYTLVYHEKESGRTAYSFCMCPGGQVVAAASETGCVVTNGMSFYARDSGIANSALVVNVNPKDCGSSVLDGMEFQRHYEALAYACGGRSYYAPVQTVGNFLKGTTGSSEYLVDPSYQPGVTPADLHRCLPGFVTTTLAGALPEFGRKIAGFDHQGAVMTGVETRTSAPLRIVRGSGFMSMNIAGLYPIGEGAGYAGGIMSAALDGMNAAINIIREYRIN